MIVIVGLGNPGKKYDATRHNVGFDLIDYLSHRYDIKVNKLKHKALIGEGVIEGEKVLLVKPQTFMNLSGQSVLPIVQYYNLAPDQLIVAYDDIDTDMGKLRIRKKGSAGTHNGMKNIIYLLKNDQFPRVRIGIGKPERGDLKDFVLKRFSRGEALEMKEVIERAGDAVACMIGDSVDNAMNQFNG